ncbi:SDR family oxidoreductase [Leptolyngbya sp. AN02str]|uniref:SDR family oxidoreductase n=1 Tax=Leptolyngbya sp. AN02str TaxID=3423363 RepID=UPI003D31B732
MEPGEQPAQQTLFITGISGFLGAYVGRVAASQWRVVGSYRSTPAQIPHVAMLRLDLTDSQAIAQTLMEVRPQAVIHLAAISKPNVCEQDVARSHAVNVTAAVELANRCAEANIPLVFTSTDLVFDGLGAPYCETDAVNPMSVYGEQKAKAEQAILAGYPQAVVCRMPLMYGACARNSNFLPQFVNQVRSGQSLKLFVDEFRTPVSGYDAALGLLLALNTAQGILHLGGRDRLSRYEFGRQMAEVFELPMELICTSHRADVAMAAPRPPDVSLHSSRAFALGYAPQTVWENLVALRGQI